jgi:putative transposase
MDLCCSRIVALEMAKRPEYELMGSLLKKALANRIADENSLLYLDQSWQASNAGLKAGSTEKRGMQSIARKENCLNHAVMKFFPSANRSSFISINLATSMCRKWALSDDSKIS